LDFGRGEDKFYVGGRLFQSFEKSIEGLGGEHMDFIDDIDFKLSSGGGVRDAFPKFLDAFNASIGGAVDLQDVEAATLLDLFADIVVWVEVSFGAFGAVEGFGEDAGGGGFPDSAGADKKKGVGQTTLGNGVGQGTDDMILADKLRKGARAVFAGENKVTHRKAE
jgi:hypothetical protein